jgi:hypothetical protein
MIITLVLVGLGVLALVVIILLTKPTSKPVLGTQTERLAFTACHEFAKRKYPTLRNGILADFTPGKVSIVAPEIYEVRSYVDSPQVFGPAGRTQFECMVTRTEENWVLIGLGWY